MNGLQLSRALFSMQGCPGEWISRTRFETDLVPIRSETLSPCFILASPRDTLVFLLR